MPRKRAATSPYVTPHTTPRTAPSPHPLHPPAATAAAQAADSGAENAKPRKRARTRYAQRSLYVSQAGRVLLEPRRRRRARRSANDGGAGATDDGAVVIVISDSEGEAGPAGAASAPAASGPAAASAPAVASATPPARAPAATLLSLPSELLGLVFSSAASVLKGRQVSRRLQAALPANSTGISLRIGPTTASPCGLTYLMVERFLAAFASTPQVRLHLPERAYESGTSNVPSIHTLQWMLRTGGFDSVSSFKIDGYWLDSFLRLRVFTPGLRELYLVNADTCLGDDTEFKALFANICGCPNLVDLYISRRLTFRPDQIGAHIPMVLQACPKLHTLRVVNCGLQTASVRTLVDAVQGHACLRVLDYTQADTIMPEGSVYYFPDISEGAHHAVITKLLPRLSQLNGVSLFNDAYMGQELLREVKRRVEAPGAVPLEFLGLRGVPWRVAAELRRMGVCHTTEAVC